MTTKEIREDDGTAEDNRATTWTDRYGVVHILKHEEYNVRS